MRNERETAGSSSNPVVQRHFLFAREADLRVRLEQRAAEVLSEGGWPESDPLYQRLWSAHRKVELEIEQLDAAPAPERTVH
ncbi:MAG: hypothetical protein DIU74_007165 [Pseudomonadota bacterium]